jgi:amidase
MPHRLPLTRMAALIRSRELSPIELVEAHLRQIEKHNPRLNAFIAVYADEARGVARRATEALGGRHAPGPLYGVPVTVKDSFDMAGKVTTGGSRLRLKEVAAEDSVPVARLRRAGAIILGKTNLPEFLMNYESDNGIIGRTSNPWNLERTAGGSSGGESAAIAAFCSPGGIGSDAGGSIREPAHFCGIAGLKPTPGRCPGYGHWPSIGHPGGLLGVGGPMARTARDVRELFGVLAGHDSRDPFSVPIEIRTAESRGVRVAVMEQFGEIPVQKSMRTAVRRAVALLGALGHDLEPFATRPLERAPELWRFLFIELPAQMVFQMIEGREEECHWTGLELFNTVREKGAPPSGRVIEALMERDRLRGETLRRMEAAETPVILAPACGVTAFAHRQRRYATDAGEIGLLEAMAPLTVWNLLGFPAVTVPMVVSDEGLPAGVQLIGAPYSEELLLDLAERLEEARGAFPAPPGYAD